MITCYHIFFFLKTSHTASLLMFNPIYLMSNIPPKGLQLSGDAAVGGGAPAGGGAAAAGGGAGAAGGGPWWDDFDVLLQHPVGLRNGDQKLPKTKVESTGYEV
jgi:hypothetical protein